METIMTQQASIESAEEQVKISNLLKFTPDLGNYIKSYIFDNIDKPQNIIEERFSIYDGWERGNIQRARLCIFFTEFNHKKECDDTMIVSYFLHISPTAVKIFLPSNENNIPDITIPFPTDG